MKIYADKERKKPLEVIHFGKVEAGQSKTITVYLYNESTAILTNLKFLIGKNIPEATQVSIIKPPITIQSKKVQSLKLKWSPARTFKKALEIMIVIEGEAVYVATRKFAVKKVKK